MATKEIDKHKAQTCAAIIALVIGCALIVAGIVIPPRGEIHPSVLIAFGECLTFAGAVLGVKYHFDFKEYLHSSNHKTARAK